MRQFLTVRFWMTLVALLGLTIGVWAVTRRDSAIGIAGASHPPRVRRIDLISQIFSTNADSNFSMTRGVASGELRLTLDATRTMIIKPGTPGEISCPPLDQIGACVVAADLLGEAVLWFSIIPSEPRPSITLPAIAALRDDNYVVLTNGWELKRSSVVELNCADETSTLTEFVRRFGAASTTTFNFAKQQLVRATCDKASEATTTVPTTGPDSTGPDSTGDTVAPDATGDTNAPGSVDSAPDASNSGIG